MNPTDLANQAQALAERASVLAAQARLIAETQIVPAVQQGAAAADPFLFLLTIFLLACFVGYYVVWNVTPALHSPLMGVTNAISSVIVVGAILAAGSETAGYGSILGGIAVALVATNTFGGFMVTHRMLEMFKRKDRGKERGGPVDRSEGVGRVPRGSQDVERLPRSGPAE